MRSRCFRVGVLLAMPLLTVACAGKSPFPSEARDKVAPHFDFTAWRDASPSNPGGKSDAGMKVELGGRIVQATKQSKGVLVVAEQLPIAKYPVYGPTDAEKRKGEYEFAFLYPSDLSLDQLQQGNRFVVIGTTSGRKPVVVNGTPKSEPYLVADCLHVWQAGRTGATEVKGDAGTGAVTLPETTSCAPAEKH